MFRLRSIDHIRLKIKAIGDFIDKRDVYACCIVIFVGVSSFFLGRLDGIDSARPPVTIEGLSEPSIPVSAAKEPALQARSQAAAVGLGAGKYVGSISGAKYHLPACPGAQRIAEANKVWFSTREEAEAAGYAPAANCKGI
ncbi:MAG: hypothetical protein HZA81_00095 [Candidatus Taylorbacteria bacterium]|nr:hypothetical protein [Candidatus Taylorbacteria bacterium]